MTPGALIRERRLAHGLSQARLALRAGTTQAAISRLENDELSPTFETLSGVLAVLGEAPVLNASIVEPQVDPGHLRAQSQRSPAERLELAIGWNRLAGEVAQAGERARSR
jgi:transcriptional regulator with XRE-family HTH domain